MRSTGLKLGVFTVFTIIVTFWLASVIGKLSPFDDSYRINAVFTDATGVLNGDPVKIAGVVVGKVVDFKVQEGEAHVSMEIQGEVDLPENTIADIKFLNLLGQRVINLEEPEEPSTEELGDGGTIPLQNTRPALDLSVNTVADPLRLGALAARYGVPVPAVHGPFLVATWLVFGTDPKGKLERCVRFAEEVAGRRMTWSYKDANRTGDHIWWIGDNGAFESDYPAWKQEYDVRRILEETFEFTKDRWQ